MLAVLTAMAVNFMPLLAPTNQMSYDTAQFYNIALAIFVGCGTAALSFQLLPPSRRQRGRVACSTSPSVMCDASRSNIFRRHCTTGKSVCTVGSRRCLTRPSPCNAPSSWPRSAWGARSYDLRSISALELDPEFDAALAALAEGRSNMAIAQLARLDRRLAFVT